jgi:hypothetical protein
MLLGRDVEARRTYNKPGSNARLLAGTGRLSTAMKGGIVKQLQIQARPPTCPELSGTGAVL